MTAPTELRPPAPSPLRTAGPLMAAFLRRDWKITVSYRLGFASQLVQSLVTVFFLYFLGRLVGARGVLTGAGSLRHGYFPFAVLGVALLGVVGGELNAVSTQIRTDQTTGTLEALMAMPPPPWLTVLGGVSFQLAYAAVVAVVTVLMGVVGFGLRFDASVAGVVAAAAAFLIALVLFSAFGAALASVAVVFKRGGQVAGALATAFSLLGGVYYPLSLLPVPLRWLGDALPFTWTLDIIRAGLLEGQARWAETGLLAAATVVLAPAALATLSGAVVHSRRRGTLGQY
ncbi:MAG TPA: ABC transporter permease [Acidimicrobiales bacterium]